VQKIVVEDRLAEDVSSWFEIHRDAALFPVVARVREGHGADEVLERVQAGLDEVAQKKIDAARFAAVQSHVRYALLTSLTDADAVAGTLARFAGPSMSVRAIDEVLAAVARLKPDDLAAYVRRHFGRQQRAVAVVRRASEGSK
jgi:predicted Zn-dependent peptidase